MALKPQDSANRKPSGEISTQQRSQAKPPPLPKRRSNPPEAPPTPPATMPAPTPAVSSGAPTANEPIASPPVATTSEAALPQVTPYSPWLHNVLRRLQSSAAFATSLTVHLVLILALSLFFLPDQIREVLVITSTPAEVVEELEEVIPELAPLDPLEVVEPISEPQVFDTGDALDQFADATNLDATIQPNMDDFGVSGTIDEAVTRSLMDGFGPGKFKGKGGLFDDSFDGMVEYARTHGLDIVIVFDSTGSMGGDIANVKDRIQLIATTLIKRIPGTRVGLVTYRDKGDEYEAKGLPLSEEVDYMQDFLNNARAGGGGDLEEAVQSGMEYAMRKNAFRKHARKVMLIFGDAPPHKEDLAKCLALADEFHRYEKGIVTTITVRSAVSLPEFASTAKIGGGSALSMNDTRLLMEEMLVQVFGEKHRKSAVKFFNLSEDLLKPQAGGVGPPIPIRPLPVRPMRRR